MNSPFSKKHRCTLYRATLREFSLKINKNLIKITIYLKHKEKLLSLSTLFFADNSILNHIYIQFQGLYIMKIAIAGTGYIGLSNAVLLSQHNTVLTLELIADNVDIINNRLPLFKILRLSTSYKNLKATLDKEEALQRRCLYHHCDDNRLQ